MVTCSHFVPSKDQTNWGDTFLLLSWDLVFRKRTLLRPISKQKTNQKRKRVGNDLCICSVDSVVFIQPPVIGLVQTLYNIGRSTTSLYIRQDPFRLEKWWKRLTSPISIYSLSLYNTSECKQVQEVIHECNLASDPFIQVYKDL